ncbi:EH domain-containing protein 3 [Galendromus occidentalis]|uniref:EH domain-containing protein 3 n=1 Tax=Galendromus occidentalis TaxID=34638 RepID=A0AAJ6VYR6_9ACAR|nr:EH domain-containing protein 3 [Galendromus occidentalis]
MPSRKKKSASTPTFERYTTVVEGLKAIYNEKILPLEEQYLFHEFCTPKLQDSDFDAKPTVLLIGQYSTGKTTFIKYLIDDDFPGDLVGPEPTTDRFIALMNGPQDGVIPGHAVVVDNSKPFMSLGDFGSAFLQRFQISLKDSPVLRSLTIVDSPGILSGEKQRVDRGYNFTEVLKWFAARVDRIILLFDAHKLDISDEFRRSIEVLRGHDEKIRIVLNKADMIDQQALMRVYGALMWSLGKILLTPEVVRVYIGTFWDEALKNDDLRKLFEAEECDLFREIGELPCTVAWRKLNDLLKRARQAKVNAYIVDALNEKYNTSMFRHETEKKKIIKSLPLIFAQIQKKQNFAKGDFPDVDDLRQKLMNIDWSLLKGLNKKLVEGVDDVLLTRIPSLVKMLQSEQETEASQQRIRGGKFDRSIFENGRGEGADKGSLENGWVVEKHRYLGDFEKLKDDTNKVCGAVAKQQMVKSNLPNSILGKIWRLADIDRDGALDEDEYCLAMHLVGVRLEGYKIPNELPRHLLPPRRRGFISLGI